MQPESPKTAMPVVAGILTLISGGLKLLGVLGMIIAGFFISFAPRMERQVPASPGDFCHYRNSLAYQRSHSCHRGYLHLAKKILGNVLNRRYLRLSPL